VKEEERKKKEETRKRRDRNFSSTSPFFHFLYKSLKNLHNLRNTTLYNTGVHANEQIVSKRHNIFIYKT